MLHQSLLPEIAIRDHIPTKAEANWLVFSMQSIEGIDDLLNAFPIYNDKTGQGLGGSTRGCCSTVIWTGKKGFNIPIQPFQNYKIGIILDPFKINVPQADFTAQLSLNKIYDEILKKDALSKERMVTTRLESKYPHKAVYLRKDIRNKKGNISDEYTTNQSRHKPVASGLSIYLPKGNIWNFALRVLDKFKRHRLSRKPTSDNYILKNGMMCLNEAIVFQKYPSSQRNANPIAGLFITAKPKKDDSVKLLSILKKNPSLQLYFYDTTADEHMVRYINNQEARDFLKGPDSFAKVFNHAKPFQGFIGETNLPKDPADQLDPKIAFGGEMLKRIPSLLSTYKSHEMILQIYDEAQECLDQYKDLALFWDKIVNICKQFDNHFDSDNGNISLLCNAITEWENNVKEYPTIQTLKELVITQQKRDFITTLEETPSQPKAKAFLADLVEQIKGSESDTKLGDILAEDSLFMKSIQEDERKFFSDENLDKIRDELVEMDPKIVIGEVIGDKAYQKQEDYRKQCLLLHTALIEMRQKYILRKRKTHIKDIDELIIKVTNDLGNMFDDYQTCYNVIIQDINKAYEQERQNFIKPSFFKNEKSVEEFNSILDKNSNSYCYPRMLRTILNKVANDTFVQKDKYKLKSLKR